MIDIKQNLFIDFDGTIVNSIKAYCDTYIHYYKNIPWYKEPFAHLVNKWDLSDQCPLAKDHVENIFGDSYFFEVLNFMPKAYEIIKILNDKYNIHIVTIGNTDNLAFKNRWIEKNLSFIKNVILIKNEGIQMNKSMINMEGGIFIDDVNTNLVSTNADMKICFGKEYEWNAQWKGLRCSDWIEVYKKLIE